MSVVFKAEDRKFTADEVMWSKQELVDALIRSAIVGQTEAFLDMIMDGEGPEDITRASVNETLKGVKDSARDFLNDVMGDLQREVERRLAVVNYGAAVTGIKYDLAGDVKDIEVDVSVSFGE